MKNRLVIVLSLLVIACTQATHAPASAEPVTVSSSLIEGTASVIDGDTIEIHGQRIRLDGYDTPESGKRCGTAKVYQQAALALSDFIGTQTVTCTNTGRDRDRIVATCQAGGTDFGDHMTREGWGRDWPKFSQGRYADEEAEARALKRGLWGLACPDDLWGTRNYDP